MRRQAQGSTIALPAPLWAMLAAWVAVAAAAGGAPAARPARIAAPLPATETARELATDEKRDELIGDLQRILPRMEDGLRKAGLLFQLAEYHWEKSRSLSLREVKEYDEAYGRWMAVRDAKGEGSAGPEPRVSTRKSDAARGEALAVYRSLLADYPSYPRRDEVLFVVAYDLYESGDKPAALKTYERLIAGHPTSRFVPDAYVQLGEHFFAANDLSRARAAFEHAARGAKPRIYAFALYKLAWCDYNAGDYRGAIDKFQRVIAYSQEQARAQAGGTPGDRIQLASEALKDLVLPFAQLDEIDSAVAYFKEADGAHALESTSRLATAYFESGKFEEAIRVYRLLEQEAPAHAHAPAWQQRILLSYDKLNQRKDVEREMGRLVHDYGPASQWAKANAAERGALAEGRELSEAALRELVQDYHQEATRTKDAATYRLARDIYRQYLDTFPEAESAGRLRFYYAEILYALQDWEAAADQYDAVAAGDPKGQLTPRAAGNQILALEKALAAQGGSLRKGEPAGEEPFAPLEAKLLRACERYLAVVPRAKDEVAIRYKAALLYYDHRRFDEAAKRFGELIVQWPGDPWSQKAADLSMNILEAKRDWLALADLAGRFHLNARLAPVDKELWQRTAAVAENARFYFIMDLYQGKKDPAAAAREFLRFADAYPKSKNAAVALHNAIVIAESADELDRVIAAGERFVREHPQADESMAKPALLSLASAYARTARFDDAVRAKLVFVDRFPDDPRAPDGLTSAALWKEATGDDEGALALWHRFLRAYGSHPDAVKVAFNVGLLHERRKEWPLALAAWSLFQRVHGRRAPPGELLLARFKEAIALRELHSKDAKAALESVVARYGALPDREKLPAVADAAAHARFLLAERPFEQFLGLRFTSNRQSELVSVLNSKNKSLVRLADTYAEVIRIGSPSWSEAALTRLGAAYRDFNKALLDAPSPRGLDPEQQELYRGALERQALPLEDKAVEAFQKALEIGSRLGVYTEWTLRAQELLRDYRPDTYREARSPAWSVGEPAFTMAPEGLAVAAQAGQPRPAQASPTEPPRAPGVASAHAGGAP
jgi:cellulose synthase operon protein C